MSTTTPIPRDDRRQTYLAAAGQSVFGPADFKVWDALDVAVWRRGATDDAPVRLTTGFTVALSGTAPAYPTVTFSGGQAVDAQIIVEGSRLQERLTDVTRAGSISSPALEAELDRESVVLQELRRDMDDPAARPPIEFADLSADLQALISGGSTGVSFTPPGTGGVTQAVSTKLAKALDESDYSPDTLLATRAYENNAMMRIRRGRATKRVCNPSAGDDLQDMARWIAALHYTEENASLYLEIADGLHNVNTYIDITKNHVLDIRGSAQSDVIQINSIAIANVAGAIYEATLVLASAVRAYVLAGYSVGVQCAKGDNSADAINGGHALTFVSGDGLTVKFRFRVSAVAPTSPTVLDNVVDAMGLLPNRLIVPRFCVRANSAAWDGSSREGFLNAIDGGRIQCLYTGWAFNGSVGAQSMIFSRRGVFGLMDYDVVAGAGDAGHAGRFDNAEFYISRGQMGAGIVGRTALTMQNTGRGVLSRVSMSGGSDGTVTAVDGIDMGITHSFIVGGDRGVRTTYANSKVELGNVALRHCNTAIDAKRGEIEIDSDGAATTTIIRCGTPIALGTGVVTGPVTASANSFALPAQNQWVNGGAWRTSDVKVDDPNWRPLARGSAVLNFGSIAAGTYADLTIGVTGAALGDSVNISNQAAEAAQGIVYRGFVSAADVVTVRAFNITAGAIDPAAATWFASVAKIV